jgi:hypothetical protein
LLEAWKVIAEDRLAKLEAYVHGVEVSDDLAELDDLDTPKRRPGRPRKDAAA